jgi:hypothetical protein
VSYVILYDWDEPPESALSFAYHEAASPRLLAVYRRGVQAFRARKTAP